MQVDIHNTSIEKVGTVDLPDAIFATDAKPALLWEQVRAQRAGQHRGTHQTKTRATVSGTGAKPLRQKGSGNARQGSRRAPHFVGGGVSMGPRPRSYAYRLPRSARKAALRSALSVRVAEEKLLVLDQFEFADPKNPKTREVAAFLKKLGTKSALLVDVDNANLRRSTRNLPKSKCIAAQGLSVYDILNHEKLVITQAALEPVIAKAEKSDGKAGEAGEQGVA